MQKTNRSLSIMLFIFALPVIVSWLLYHYHEHFHLKTNNKGVLFNTPIFVKELKSPSWKVIYVSESCDTQCKQMLYQLGQVKKALGKDGKRVTVLSLPSNTSYLTNIKQVETILLADPLGNLFMSYAINTDPMNVLKDLKHVLEVSQIG